MKKLFFFMIALLIVSGAKAQWYPVNTAIGGGHNSIFFTDVNTGYADGMYEGMITTTDGGVTWYPQGSVCCGPVFFLNSDRGWDGLFWRTNDGGLTWTEGTSSGLPNSIYFTDIDTGYAVGGWSGIIPHPAKYIGKTTDGGANWTTLMSGADTSLNSGFFINANTGYIVGGFGTILKTTDGGSTWITQSSGTNLELFQVLFLSQDTGYIVGESGIILKTVNGGSVWIQQLSGTNADLLSVSFTDVNTGYAVGTDFFEDVILKTNNGGSNWWFQSSSGTCGNFQKVFFPSADTGYILAGGCLLKTENGGGLPAGTYDISKPQSKLSIYPNPASTLITIEMPSTLNTSTVLTISSVNGQQLIKQQVSGQQATVNVSGLSPGVYVVKVKSDDRLLEGKLLKQ